MKIKFITLFFLFLIQLNAVIGQDASLFGKVVDTEKTPIEFVNILLQKTNDTAITRGSITDINGNFNINLPTEGVYKITVSFIGFKDWKKTITINQKTDLGNVLLENTTNELGEVVVTSTAKVIERKEDKLIFNVAASPLKSGFDGMEVLQRAPNILVDENGEIMMRNEAVTVLINGRISNLGGAELANYLSNLRSEDIKNIEIQTHLSSNTDAESSGGVINIILKKKTVGFNGMVRTEFSPRTFGDYATQSSTNFNYGAEKWNIYGSYNFMKRTSTTARDSKIDYFSSGNLLLEDGTWKNIRQRHNYQLGVVIDAIKNHVFGAEFFGTQYINDFSQLNIVDFTNNNISLENGEALLEGVRSYDLNNFTFNYAWTVDTLGSSLKVFADYATQNEAGNNNAFSTYEKSLFPNNTERNITNADTKIYSLQADWEQYFLNKIKLETGTKFSFTDRGNILLSDFLFNDEWTPNERTSSFNYGEQVLAGYFSLSKKIQEKHFVKVGVRVENTNLEREDISQDTIIGQNYTDWFPSLYYSYDVSDNNILSFSYSKRLRRPEFFFLNNYVIKINDFRYELGNPNLRPEYVNNFEISLKQKNQSFDIYYQKTNEAVNGIYYLIGEVSYYQKFNSGSQTQYGLTYNRFGNLNKWWYINVNTGVYLRKFTDEERVDSFKRTTGYVRFSNNFKINSTTKLDISGYYRSRYEDAFYISFPIHYVNLMLEKSFFDKKLTSRIYVSDIFNITSYDNERPFENFKSNAAVKPQTRYIRLWLSYNFSNNKKVSKRKNKSKNDARGRL